MGTNSTALRGPLASSNSSQGSRYHQRAEGLKGDTEAQRWGDVTHLVSSGPGTTPQGYLLAWRPHYEQGGLPNPHKPIFPS